MEGKTQTTCYFSGLLENGISKSQAQRSQFQDSGHLWALEAPHP